MAFSNYIILNTIHIIFNKIDKLSSDKHYYDSFGNTFQELWLFCIENPKEIMSKYLLLHYCSRMVKLFYLFCNHLMLADIFFQHSL